MIAAPAVAKPARGDTAAAASRRLLLPLAGCIVAQLTVAIALIPPWQNPDEPQHLLTARLVAAQGPDFVLETALGGADERVIIESMARYGWWDHYSEPTPDPLPTTFASGPATVVATYFGPPSGGSRLYYRAVASLFGAASIEGVTAQLYTMRALSIAATLLAVWFVWSGARLLLDDRGATVVTALLALHPQFIFVSTTASPDAWVNLAGAVVWRQAALLLVSGATARDLGLLWLAASAAFVLRRLGAPLLCVAGAVTLILLWRELRRRQSWRTAAAGAAAGVLLLAAASPLLATDFTRAVDGVRFDPLHTLSTIVSRAPDLPAFFDMFFRTFWVAAGWLRYPAPAWLHGLTVGLAAIAAAGLIHAAASGRVALTALGLSAGVVAIQVLAVVIYHFGILQSGPQGRYLFPALAAVFCLVWVGWNAAVGGGRRPRLAAVSLVSIMAVLNASAWLFVVLPAYA